jgi:hypothetical protein
MKSNLKKIGLAAIAALMLTSMSIGSFRTFRNHMILERADEWSREGYEVTVNLERHTISRNGIKGRNDWSWEMEDFSNPILIDNYVGYSAD